MWGKKLLLLGRAMTSVGKLFILLLILVAMLSCLVTYLAMLF